MSLKDSPKLYLKAKHGKFCLQFPFSQTFQSNFSLLDSSDDQGCCYGLKHKFGRSFKNVKLKAKSPKGVHVRRCVLFAFFNIILPAIDVIIDISTGMNIKFATFVLVLGQNLPQENIFIKNHIAKTKKLLVE